MLVCAVVGVLLLGLGATALPWPGATVAAQPPLSAPRPAGPSAAASAPSVQPSPSASAGSDPSTDVTAGALLVPDTGPGTYARSSVSVASSTGSGRLLRFDVRVEKGLGIDPDTFGRALEKTLDDPRSWRSTGRVRFALVGKGETADLHAYLVTPGTTDRLCAPLLTGGEVSCQAGDKVVLNAKRWVFGAAAYGTDPAEIAGYREYLVNHEFGHALGHHHVGCPARGRPSPVMLQQTKGLQGCTANPWPAVTKG